MRRGILGFALVILGVMGPEAAFAQTTTATPTVSLNMAAVGRSIAKHRGRTLWISKTDCEAGDKFTFPLNVSYVQSDVTYALEAWVGTNCGDKAARGISGVPTCGRVYSSTSPGQPPVTIKLGDDQMLGALSALGQNATAQPSCTVSNGFVGTQTLTVFFMFVDGNGNSYSSQSTTGINFNLSDPAAPTGISAQDGESMVIVSWTPNTNPDVVGYYVYCDPPRGHELDAGEPVSREPGVCVETPSEPSTITTGEVDASTGDGAVDEDASESGADGQTTTTPSANCQCPASLLVPGQKPDAAFHSAYLCGQADGLATSGIQIKGLLDGRSYNFAVATFDRIDNRGALSTVACASPQSIIDFFDTYANEAHGQLGSSFCSVRAPSRRTSGLVTLVALGSAVALRALRRRKRGASAGDACGR